MKELELLTILTNVRSEYILQAQQLRAGSQKQLRLLHKKRILLIAAVVSLLLLLVGCTVVYVLNMQNMKIGEYNATIPSCEADPLGQVISSDMISLQGLAGTPSYQASKEWQDFLKTYDPDGTLRKKADAEGYREPEDYENYICYTQQMQDKIDEICQKYGLEILGPVTMPDNMHSVLDLLGIDTILAENSIAVTDLYPGYCYKGGTFALEGETVFAPETSPWIYPIDFQYRCVMKNAFDGVFLTVGDVDTYDQWNYTLSDGTPVLLAAGPEKGLIIVDKPDYFVTVNVLPREGEILGGEQRTVRAAMESFSDVFSFAYTPHKMAPQPEHTQPETFPNQTDTPTHRAFRNALKTIHDKLYWPDLPGDNEITLFAPGTIEDEQFAILDVDGDGQEELLVSVSNTYSAGMCEVIYGYDSQTDDVFVQARNYVAVTHYPGMLKVDASHNHGYAGDVLWPYVVMNYDEGKDVYEDAFYVDAWSREITDYNPYEEMPYPDDIDTEQDGYVYLITENGQKRILNRADYQRWEAALFAGKEPLTIPWQKITVDNIQALDAS